MKSAQRDANTVRWL